MFNCRCSKSAAGIGLILVLVLSMALVAGCSKTPKVETLKGNFTAVGSTALQPLVDEASKQFMTINTGVQISVAGGGSGTGLSQVSSGAAQIGNSDIFAEEKSGVDASQLVDFKVAVVGMAAVVNPNVTVTDLTTKQLVDIFTGKVTNWKEVGGENLKIVVVNRAAGSGTRATFKKFALGGAEEVKSMEEDANGTVRTIVKTTPGAISYLALSYIDSSVKALGLNGVAPTKDNIVTGRYAVWAYEHMYTKGQPTGAVKAFMDYMLSKDVQTTLVPKLGYIPATDMKVVRDASGKVTNK